jgi:hypothetical protein
MPQLRGTRRKNASMAAPAGPIRGVAKQPKITYADARAKKAWEIRQRVAETISSLPAEDQNLRAKTITFDSGHMSDGTYAIFFAGTVVGTDRAGVFLVPERTLSILERLRIPYQAA